MDSVVIAKKEASRAVKLQELTEVTASAEERKKIHGFWENIRCLNESSRCLKSQLKQICDSEQPSLI